MRNILSVSRCIGLILVITGCATTQFTPPGNIVETEYGLIRGFADDEKTWSWKGIPYAKPPTGTRRWKAPAPPDPWTGVRDARTFASPCAQKPFPNSPVIGSEDCLYLNIWRPRNDLTELPVYVFIHGGGNATGSADMFPDYHGAPLAHKANIVYVSVNYRLGPFGWFLHPALAEESADSPLDASGNYGLLDIILSLEWIRKNIAAFGGNPDNVTVAGQSAGGTNVLALMLSDRASGLFHRAICQSGVLLDASMEEGYRRGKDVFNGLVLAEGAASNLMGAEQIASSLSPEEKLHYLKTRSPEEILTLYEVVPQGLVSFPFHFTDGTVLPKKGFKAFENGTYPNKVPLIIGSNRDEFSTFNFPRSPAESRTLRHHMTVALGSKLWKAEGVDEVARNLTKTDNQPPVYVYHFLWGSNHREMGSVLPGDWSTILGSCHSLEIPFFTGNHDCEGNSIARPLFTRMNRKGRTELSDRMIEYVANFLRSGNPNIPVTPQTPWEQWSNEPADPKCIVFDAGLKEADIYMSYQELYAAEILDFYKGYMEPELFESVMDKIFWR